MEKKELNIEELNEASGGDAEYYQDGSYYKTLDQIIGYINSLVNAFAIKYDKETVKDDLMNTLQDCITKKLYVYEHIKAEIDKTADKYRNIF